jgi:sirohydrochlorin cobaltochelatase
METGMVAARVALDKLDARLRILLPEQYQESYESVQPVSMRSAGLKFAPDGTVAWDEMWQTFCDLAMAGGPPHKGTLLGPGAPADITANLDRYDSIVEEICRGIWMAADLPAQADTRAGWVRVQCHSATMADWLMRAIVMENVAARASGIMLFLPAAPHFRLDKEIKNVITVIAKTAHYWTGHMSRSQKVLISDMFSTMSMESPFLEPAIDGWAAWRGFDCSRVAAAVWMTRALVAFNVASRRERLTVFVPINEEQDPGGAIAQAAIARVQELASFRDGLAPSGAT